MGFDLLANVPYLTIIGLLLITVLVLLLYIYFSGKRKRKHMSTQTYFTCLPKKLSDGEQERHGLQKMSLTKGKRMEFAEKTRYTREPSGDATNNNTHETAYNMPNEDHMTGNATMTSSIGTGNKPTRTAPQIPVPPKGVPHHTHEEQEIPPPLPDKESYQHDQVDNDYVNTREWFNTNENQYRVSQMQIVDTSKEIQEDDLVSTAFTNDSFETYDDEYINTQKLGQIHRNFNK